MFTGTLFQQEQPIPVVTFWEGILSMVNMWPIFLWYKMTQYNTLNVKLSNSQLNKLKSGIKNGTEVTFKLSSNVVVPQLI